VPRQSLSAEGEGPWVTTAQKCVRAGGKGCDLHEIGASPRHLSFFEMLGSFRLPPTSGREMERANRHWAMANAFSFLTEELRLDPSRIRASVLQGDEDTKLFWQSLLPAESVFECGFADNFWSMGGDRGVPCGPCTELYYDFSAHLPTDSSQQQQMLPPDDPHCMELWNLVFMQHEHPGSPPVAAGTAFGGVSSLPGLAHGGCIDTGMGLERLTSVVQGVQNSTFKIDSLSSLISRIRQRLLEVTGKTEASMPYADFSDAAHARDEAVRHSSASLRVIADHIRSAVVILADGVIPSATGRGHVLRRVIRRAVLHARLLGLGEQQVLASFVPFVEESLAGTYPEIRERRESIERLLELEEELTHRSLGRGLKALEEAIDRVKTRGQSALEARVVHELHDSLGFPAELVSIFAERRGVRVPMEEVDALIEEQRERSRASWVGSGDVEVTVAAPSASGREGELVRKARHEPYGPFLEVSATVVAVLREETAEVTGEREQAEGGSTFVALDPCPFYAEGGGQTGDRGVIHAGGESFAVVDCKRRAGGVFAEVRQQDGSRLTAEHYRTLTEARTSEATVRAGVDVRARAAASRNHTATHLLHAALRRMLGPAVHQAGSYVGPERLRFDFTAPAPLTEEELRSVEESVRKDIDAELEVTASEHSQEEARAMDALSLFSDKHTSRDLVRVVAVGGGGARGAVSREWCGGTHAANTRELRPFVITSERSVAAGTRRIEALTASAAEEYLLGQRSLATAAAGMLRTAPGSLLEELQSTLENERKLAQALEQERLHTLVRSLPAPLSGTLPEGGLAVAVYDVTAVTPPTPAGEGAKGKKRTSLLQQLRAVAPSMAAADAARPLLFIDDQMALCVAAQGSPCSAAEALREVMAAVPGAKAAGKPSDSMGMLRMPSGAREAVLAALRCTGTPHH